MVFDKAYNDYYGRYAQWTDNGIYSVTGQKNGAAHTGIEELDLSHTTSDAVLKDERKHDRTIGSRWDADKNKVFESIGNDFR